MNAALLVSLVVALLILRVTAEPISLGGGEITLPPGATHNKQRGIDTEVGSFRSSDGTPEVHYDIGWQPGDFSAPKDTSPFTFFRAGTVNDMPYWAAIHRNDPNRISIVFPKSGPACFWASITTRDDADKVLKLVLRYTPTKK